MNRVPTDLGASGAELARRPGTAHWANVVVELDKRGYDEIRAVENPLTSLAEDAERTRKMIKQAEGPVVLVGHSYGGTSSTSSKRP
ncbi:MULTISPECIES: hypothetical protein [unclassified Streptomyces]|uniref:hypothetical protein n=1 Tax=unclassified Streptomyces TaxID=2593676 RepID=UPI0035D90256